MTAGRAPAAETETPPLRIAVLPGDGIGPEVTAQAERVLRQVAEERSLRLEIAHAAVGGEAIDRFGDPLPGATLGLCKEADAVLLGAVGGPRWSDPGATMRPEDGLLRLRAELGLFANLRPIRPHRRLRGASPLRPELLDGVDLVFVRELTGGLYFGPRGRRNGSAFDTCVYSEEEVERVVRFAARLAGGRRGKLTSIDKANVLETSRLWRATAERVVREEFPDLQLDHRYVDAAAMQLISDPAGFDVIVTENLFGDILSDEGAVLCGSLGMLPSASLGEGSRGLYEPVHGSAPDIAGKGIANPYAAILCVAMLLRHSLADEAAAQAVERAVDDAIDDGFVTADLAAGMVPIGTEVAADAVVERLGELI